MKIEKSKLLNGLKLLSSTIGKTIDLVVFEMSENGTWAKTTNGNSSTWHFFEELKGDCEISLVFSQFMKVVNVCNDEIKFDVKEKEGNRSLVIKSGNKKQTVSIVENTIDNIVYPNVEFKELNENFLGAVSRVVACASVDDSNYVLKSVKVDSDVLSTDGRRLAIEYNVADFESTLPSQDMLKIISDFGSGGNKYYCDCECFIISNGYTIRKIKQVDGDYPNAKRIIPNESEMNKISINSVSFKNAVNDFINVCGQDSILDIEFNNNSAILKSSTSVLEYSDSVECSFNGDFTVSVNPKFIKSAFDSFVGEIYFYYNDNVSPIVISDGECKFVMMPIRKQ